MRLRQALSRALARLTGERAALTPFDDPAYQALCLNLSYILRQPMASAQIRQAAATAWQNRAHQCQRLPQAVWPANALRQLAERPGLIVIPPAGCTFCPTCITRDVTGYLLSAAAEPSDRLFFGEPAPLWLTPIADAVTENRPIWFGWIAETRTGAYGDLVEIFNPANPRPQSEIIDDILRRCETVLRSYPEQCVADTPLWDLPYHSS